MKLLKLSLLIIAISYIITEKFPNKVFTSNTFAYPKDRITGENINIAFQSDGILWTIVNNELLPPFVHKLGKKTETGVINVYLLKYVDVNKVNFIKTSEEDTGEFLMNIQIYYRTAYDQTIMLIDIREKDMVDIDKIILALNDVNNNFAGNLIIYFYRIFEQNP
jgi:hypothetical protein